MRYWPVGFALLLGCSNPDAPLAPVVAPLLSIIAGDVQTDTVLRTLPVQIGARLTDKATGAPLPGRVVNWLVIEGGGTVFVPVTQTGSDGIARQSYTLGPTSGRQRLVARWLDPETGEPVTLDTVEATALAGSPVSISITPDSLRVYATGSDTLGIAIASVDAHGNAASPCASLVWASDDSSRVRPLGLTRKRIDGYDALFYVDVTIGGPPVHLSVVASCGGNDAVVVQTFNQ